MWNKFFYVGLFMERIYLDFLGFLFMSKKKNLLILIMIDWFIKWVECIFFLN